MSIEETCGFIASILFVSSNLPMLLKAYCTKDLKSYSPYHLAASNIGNVLFWVYVLDLPNGPIQALHAFNTISAGLMIFWYFLYKERTEDDSQK